VCGRIVRDQDRRRAGRLGQGIRDAIEYAAAADFEQSLGRPGVPRGGAAGDDRAGDDQ
jgi:hypothetical protein